MREIKFNYILQHEETGRITSETFLYSEIYSGKCRKTIEERYKGYSVVTVRRFTGLMDLNYQDIFAGDVVRQKINSRGKLYDSNYWKNIKVVEIVNGRVNLIYKEKIRWEVIGNIWETPDLIK